MGHVNCLCDTCMLDGAVLATKHLLILLELLDTKPKKHTFPWFLLSVGIFSESFMVSNARDSVAIGKEKCTKTEDDIELRRQ